jgi:1,4-dihydroxy-2-naphthoate octaprenyltransferase
MVLSFFFLGICSIIAAIKYTAGKGAYGYSGFGDIFVFLFFGILGVSGSAFLTSGIWQLEYLFIGSTIGAWSAGVLNLNNLRDLDNDLNFNKRTIPVRIGFKKGKQYHIMLILLGLISSLALIVGKEVSILNLTYVISFIPIFLHLKRFSKISTPENMDPELKKLALSTFLFSLLLLVSNF